MNKSILLCLAILAVGTLAATAPELDEGVYVLTDANFNDFVSSKPFVLVEFYAPWCGHCKNLAPEYIKAAKGLIDQNINAVVAKVDATVEKTFAEKFGVKGFPTLKFFAGDVSAPVDYNGGRTEKDIINWLKKRTGPVSNIVATAEELTALTTKNLLTIIYFGESENDSNWSVFKSLAMTYDEIVFAHVFNTELRAANKATGTNFVLFKQFDEGRNDFTESVSLENLKKFVDANSFPTVMPFNDRAIPKIFQQQNPTVILFSNNNDASVTAEAAFAEAAKQNKGGKVLFSVSKVDDGFGHFQKLGEYLGADIANSPVVILVHTTNDVAKYKFTEAITVETLNQYVKDFNNGKLQTYIKSEPVPASNDQPVKVIVGTTFNELVLNSSADVLVEFYAPWCGHCKALAPIYEAVAAKLANNKNLVIAKIDLTANEIPGLNVQGYPTLKFYPKGKKSSPVDFSGDKTDVGLIKFLKDNVTYTWVESNEEVQTSTTTKSDL